MTNQITLLVEDLEVSYGNVHAVRRANLSIRTGRMGTLIGSNGAGKTTILAAITGLQPVAKGRIHFRGEDITNRPTDEIVRRGIVLVPEGRRLFTNMKVRENLEIGAYLRKDHDSIRRDFDLTLDYFPDLKQKLNDPVESLSGGQQQMVAVARGLMASPKLLMLDEPTIGLAPNLVQRIAKIVRAICDDGVDVLLIEQNASMALNLAEDAFVLENGEVVLEGSAAELRNDDNVRRAYLGV